MESRCQLLTSLQVFLIREKNNFMNRTIQMELYQVLVYSHASCHSFCIIITGNMLDFHQVNMFSNFYLRISTMALLATIVIAQDMACKPALIVPGVKSLIRQLQSFQSFIELFCGLKSTWVVHCLDLKALCCVFLLWIFILDLELEIQEGVLDAHTRIFENPVQTEEIIGFYVQEIYKKSTHLNLQRRPAI